MAAAMYLEHYLDSIENLPNELQRNFQLMRDLDQRTDDLKGEIGRLAGEFLSGAMDGPRRSVALAHISSAYGRCREYGDDKVQLAMQTYEMVDKHIRRLDADLARFEAELKEKQMEPDYEGGARGGGHAGAGAAGGGHPGGGGPAAKKGRGHDRRKSAAGAAAAAASSASSTCVGGGRAGGDLSTARGRGRGGCEEDGAKGGGHAGAGGGSAAARKRLKASAAQSEFPSSSSLSVGGGLTFGGLVGVHPSDVLDMPVDPNEPTYCLCHQVSYGEMIGCDNPDCSIEWFHFSCVGLSTKPKGKWFCPRCSQERKKK